MESFFLIILLLKFSISSCTKFLNFNGTSFYFIYFLSEADVLCVNSSKTVWSFIGNDGIHNSDIVLRYKDETGMRKISKNSTDFLGFNIFGSESSIEIYPLSRKLISFALVSFDYDCDIRIISNLQTDNISSKDWPSSLSTNRKLCYFNGLSFKNQFSRKTISKSLVKFKYSDGNYENWSSKEIDTHSYHPPILELYYDQTTFISIFVEDSYIMYHGRSVLILNATNRKTDIFKGVPYDPSRCLFYDFKKENEDIKSINFALMMSCIFSFTLPVVYIITYCFCCPTCRHCRPSCLYKFGLEPTNQNNDAINPNSNENDEQISPNNSQQPVFYVYQQHISQTPEFAPQGTTFDGQYQQPVMSLTTNPPPGVYEPVRVASPIVPVTIVNEE